MLIETTEDKTKEKYVNNNNNNNNNNRGFERKIGSVPLLPGRVTSSRYALDGL
jgi:hypothetical protein